MGTWLRLTPSLTVLNNPTFFPPRYFAPLFQYLGETFRLFISGPNLLVEVEDGAAPCIIDYAKVLLKAEVDRVPPPCLNYSHRLEVTMDKPCALPISYLSRSYIDRTSPASQSQIHLPVPSDALISTTWSRGTAVEILAKANPSIQGEISRYIFKLQRRKKMKESLPLPGGEVVEHLGGAVFGGQVPRHEEVKYVEPVKDRKLEAAVEKSTSKVFECNVFIYGNSEEAIKETLSAIISSPLNSLKPFSLKRAKGSEGDKKSPEERSPPPPPRIAADEGRIVLQDLCQEAPEQSPGKDHVAGASKGAAQKPSPPFPFKEKPSSHFIAKHRKGIFKIASGAIALAAALLHVRTLTEAGMTLPALLRNPTPLLDPSSPASLASFFLPEIAASSAIIALGAALFVLVKAYRTVGLSEYELASIFSFPSPSLIEGMEVSRAPDETLILKPEEPSEEAPPPTSPLPTFEVLPDEPIPAADVARKAEIPRSGEGEED